jgi:hypothetical protein
MKIVDMFIAMLVGVLLGGVVVPLILNWLMSR